MPTIDDRNKVIALGQACEALKRNEALERVFSETISRLFAEWCNCDGENQKQMEAVHSTMKAVRELKDTIDGFVNNGAVEAKQRDFENGYNNNN